MSTCRIVRGAAAGVVIAVSSSARSRGSSGSAPRIRSRPAAAACAKSSSMASDGFGLASMTTTSPRGVRRASMRPSPRTCRMRQTRRASSASFFSSPSGSGPAGPLRMPHFLRYASSHFAFAVAKRGPSLAMASASSAGCPSSAGDGLAEEDLARRQHREPLVPEHAEVELASVDVLLDERVASRSDRAGSALARAPRPRSSRATRGRSRRSTPRRSA